MPRERMVDQGEPLWLDEPPRPSKGRVPFKPDVTAIGAEPLRTFIIQHVRLGRVRISQVDYRPEMGEILEAFEADGTPLR